MQTAISQLTVEDLEELTGKWARLSKELAEIESVLKNAAIESKQTLMTTQATIKYRVGRRSTDYEQAVKKHYAPTEYQIRQHQTKKTDWRGLAKAIGVKQKHLDKHTTFGDESASIVLNETANR